MLNGNDLALALSSVQIALSFWGDQPKSDYRRERIDQLRKLADKLGVILGDAFPATASVTHEEAENTVLVFDPALTEFNYLRAAGVL